MLLTLTTTITQSKGREAIERTPQNFIKKYKIIFSDLIVDNICAKIISEEKFKLIVFTRDNLIRQINFEGLNRYEHYDGVFSRTTEGICAVEFLDFYSSNFFVVASFNGCIYITRLDNISSSMINTRGHPQTMRSEILFEIKKTNLSDKISSFIPVTMSSLFTGRRQVTEIISHLKYIGNNLFCYTTNYFNFKIYNFKTKKEIFSNCLIKNRNDEDILSSSRISFIALDLDEDKLKEARSKCFIFTVYMENNFTHVVSSFDILFSNIPLHMEQPQDQNLQFIKNFQEYYNYIELGEDVRLKNTRIFRLQGKLIDMITYEGKIWILSEIPPLTSLNFFKYELQIFNISSIELSDLGTTDNCICFIESDRLNSKNVLNQLKSNISSLNLRLSLLENFILNDVFINSDEFIYYFNELLNSSNTGINLTNKNIMRTNFSNKNTLIFTKKHILQHLERIFKKNNEQEYFNKLIDIIEGFLQNYSQSNPISSIGFFEGSDVVGPAFIRKEGLSLLKRIGDFEHHNEMIIMHEHRIRNMIFNSEIYEKYQTHNISHLQSLSTEIQHYITSEINSSRENILFTTLALLRIYMTECNILLEDERHIEGFLCNFSFDQFLTSQFQEPLTVQFNNLSYLDFIHNIISSQFLNNGTAIEVHINQLIGTFENYMDKWSKKELIGERNMNLSYRFNSKFCEIISELALNKIKAFYQISRDLLSLTTWQGIYLHKITLESRNTVQSDKIKNIFMDSYACFLIGTHKSKIEIKDNSIIEHLYVASDNNNSMSPQYEVEVNFVHNTLYENLCKSGPKIFYEMENSYIDYIISLLIWSNKAQQKSQDIFERKQMQLISRLYKKREYKLVSTLLKLSESQNIENVFFDIIANCYLKDMVRVKSLMNNYFSILLKINNSPKDYEEITRLKRLYYDYFKNIATDTLRKDESYINIIIEGFYILEDGIQEILNGELKFQFYLNAYTFIFPCLSKSDFLQSNKETIKTKEFCINMLKSCINIDIDMALGLYSMIRKYIPNIEEEDAIIEIFISYIKHISFSPEERVFEKFLIEKLLIQDYNLIQKICEKLQKKCSEMNAPNIKNMLKCHCRLEVDSQIFQHDNDETTELVNQTQSLYMQNQPEVLGGRIFSGSVNYFSILFSIYIQLCDFQNAAQIYYVYSKKIDTVLAMSQLPGQDLIKLYKEKLVALNNVLQCLEKCSSHFVILLHNNEYQEFRVPQYVKKEELLSEKLLISARVDTFDKLSYYLKSDQITQDELNTECSNFREKNSLLNTIFKFKLYHIILHYDLVRHLDEPTARRIIINFVRVNLINHKREESRKNPLEEETLKSTFVAKRQKDIAYNKFLLDFFVQILSLENLRLSMVCLEAILSTNSEADLPENLFNQMKLSQPLWLLEFLAKYGRSEEFIVLVEFMIFEEIEVPKYLVDNVKIKFKYLGKRGI
jgi:hypothetical protein